MESVLWVPPAMDTAERLNATPLEESIKSSNYCSPTDTINDETILELDDSTKLVGVQVVLILAYSTIILFGVIGNSLVIYVVYTFKNLRTVTNFFIVNLAVADLLVNTLCLPFTLITTLYGEWVFGQVLCFMLPFAQGMAVHVSTITMNVIALDRHRSIVYHMETKMSKEMCTVVIAVTWAVSAVLASPLAIFREYKTVDLSPLSIHYSVCTEKWPEGSMNESIYSILALLFQYCLPLVINCVAYIRIWNKMKSHMTFRGRNNHQGKKKTTKMLLTMVVVFAVSWLPFHAFQLAVDIDSTVLYMADFKLLFTVFHIMAMCSTFVNPILYGWMNNNYRKAFLSVCKCYRPFRSTPRRPKDTKTPRKERMGCRYSKSTNV